MVKYGTMCHSSLKSPGGWKLGGNRKILGLILGQETLELEILGQGTLELRVTSICDTVKVSFFQVLGLRPRIFICMP